MRQVHVLETFEDIENVFCGTRMAGDSTPSVDEKDILHIHGDSLTLDSKKFVLGENVRCMGNAFVVHCIGRVMGKRFSADKIAT